MTQMTDAEVGQYAQVTLAHLEDQTPESYLTLIRHSKMELDALSAGMLGQTGDARVLQNRCWAAQHAAQLEIVKAALAAGVPSDAITAITYAEDY